MTSGFQSFMDLWFYITDFWISWILDFPNAFLRNATDRCDFSGES